MDKEEFFQLIEGEYKVAAPAIQATKLDDKKVTIYMNEGEIFLKNELAVGTKSLPALYQVTQFQCYNRDVPSTTCRFQLQLKDIGAFIHFLGVTPSVRVDRFDPKKLKLEVSPNIHRFEVEHQALVSTTLEKQ